MTRFHLVQAGSIWPFLDFLQKIGAPTGRFLARVGIPDSAFESADHLLPLGSLTRFAELAARSEGWNLGLEVGRRTLIDQFGELGRVIQSSETVGQAAAAMESYGRLYNPGLGIKVIIDERFLSYNQEHPRDYGDGYQQLDAYALMVSVNQVRHWIGSGWTPLELCVEAPMVAALRRCEDLAGCRITASPGPARMVSYRYLLTLPIPAGGTSLDRGEALEQLRQDAPPTRIEPAVRHLVRSFLPAGAPSVKQLADVFGVSVRSLQRRLAEQGTSLTAIIDETRRERAIELIASGEHSATDTAIACGYNDPANFSRAFRRWTGMSARSFRQRSSPKTTTLPRTPVAQALDP